MDAKFCTGLFEGDNPNGVKLSMGITGGDFWARISGCKNVYRGDADDGSEEIDFSKVLAVCDIEGSSIGITAVVHEADKSYLYAVRSVNCAGVEEQSLGALEKVSIDDNGAVNKKTCNGVAHVQVEQANGARARVSWQYSPINEEARCAKFLVFSNNGSGEIDFGQIIGTINHTNSKMYCWESSDLILGKWLFCVTAETIEGYGQISPEVTVDIDSKSIAGVEIANVEVI